MKTRNHEYYKRFTDSDILETELVIKDLTIIVNSLSAVLNLRDVRIIAVVVF